AADFDSAIPRFESWRPSQCFNDLANPSRHAQRRMSHICRAQNHPARAESGLRMFLHSLRASWSALQYSCYANPANSGGEIATCPSCTAAVQLWEALHSQIEQTTMMHIGFALLLVGPFEKICTTSRASPNVNWT